LFFNLALQRAAGQGGAKEEDALVTAKSKRFQVANQSSEPSSSLSPLIIKRESLFRIVLSSTARQDKIALVSHPHNLLITLAATASS
jgi:hypothetical protein